MANQHPDLINFQEYSTQDITALIKRAIEFQTALQTKQKAFDSLSGKAVFNLFYEDSTRTRMSFALAVQRLGGVMTGLPVARSSETKGESLVDTFKTLNAMYPDALVIRHDAADAARIAAQEMDCPVINAGSGMVSHPTQALADAVTLTQNGKDLSSLTIAICGDILHSRVAASNVELLSKFGATIRLTGPAELLPDDAPPGAELLYDFEAALQECDAIMMLRIQKERLKRTLSLNDEAYFKNYGLTDKRLRLAKPDALVMHPGPMNRELEIASAIADGPQSVILKQVENGVAARMAVLEYLLASSSHASTSSA